MTGGRFDRGQAWQIPQRVGMSLDEIRAALAELPPRQVPSCADWDRLADRLSAVLSKRIDTMLTCSTSSAATSPYRAAVDFKPA